MNSRISENDYQHLLAQRDALSRHLRAERVAGVLSVALTRHEDRPALLVLVTPGFSGKVPQVFEGTTVIVSETGSASVT